MSEYMHWDVVISEQIEDYSADKKLGLFNYSGDLVENDLLKGLNSLVNQKIKDSNWSVPEKSKVIHGIEEGTQVYAQELIFIDSEMPHWSRYDEDIYKVISARTLKGKDGLIEIANKEISGVWSLGRHSSFGFCLHNDEPSWHVRLFGPQFGGVKT